MMRASARAIVCASLVASLTIGCGVSDSCGQMVTCSRGNGGAGGGNGNGGEPQVCVDYLSCIAALSPATLPTLIASYGPSGSCWNQGNAIASSCTTACQTGLMQAKLVPHAPAACISALNNCNDGVQNGTESDVDCGGGTCMPCSNGRTCNVGSDCDAGMCSNGHCSGGGVVTLPMSAFVAPRMYQSAVYPPAGQTGYAVQPIANAQAQHELVIRWDGNPGHIFSGTVSTPNTIVSATIANNAEVYLSQPYRVEGGMRFDFRATDVEVDGITILAIGSGGTRDGSPLYFELAVDGKDDPTRIWYSSDGAGQLGSPTVDPFGI
jgi:hypothetical protein